ncbi:MAG TPA: hypothetical protein VGB97_04280 [Candidatus Paceibacterota bacterium]|jgi:flagellar motility protein MotE (MotC chaperone)
MEGSLGIAVLEDIVALIREAAKNNAHSRHHMKRGDEFVQEASENLLQMRDARETLRKREKDAHTPANDVIYVRQQLRVLETLMRAEMARLGPGLEPEHMHVCARGIVFYRKKFKAGNP